MNHLLKVGNKVGWYQFEIAVTYLKTNRRYVGITVKHNSKEFYVTFIQQITVKLAIRLLI